MYGIFTYIYLKSQPNVGKYAIHGWYGNVKSDCIPAFPSPWVHPHKAGHKGQTMSRARHNVIRTQRFDGFAVEDVDKYNEHSSKWAMNKNGPLVGLGGLLEMKCNPVMWGLKLKWTIINIKDIIKIPIKQPVWWKTRVLFLAPIA